MTSMTRRTALAGALGAAALAGGASAQPMGPLPPAVLGRLRAQAARLGRPLVVLAPAGSAANVRPSADAFGAMVGAAVTIREVDVDEVATVMILESLSGAPAFDVALPATFRLPDVIEAQAIRPLDDLAADLEPAGFRDTMLYQGGDSFDGRFYGYQTDGDVYLLFCNARMLDDPDLSADYADRHGTPLALPSTWAELDRQMEFLHNPGERRFGGTLYRNSTYVAWEWWLRFHARGVWPMAPDLTPQIAGDDGVAALEDLIRATGCVVGGGDGLVRGWERYGQGDVHATLGWGGSQKYFRAFTPMRDHLRVGLAPGGDVALPFFNWGWSYVVANACPAPELAFAFCLVATSPEGSCAAVRPPEGFFDPFREEHYRDPEIVALYTPQFLEVHRQAMTAALPSLYLGRQALYLDSLSRWIVRALAGDITAAEAMRHVADEWEVASAGQDRALQAARWAALRTRYPAPLRASLRDLS